MKKLIIELIPEDRNRLSSLQDHLKWTIEKLHIYFSSLPKNSSKNFILIFFRFSNCIKCN